MGINKSEIVSTKNNKIQKWIFVGLILGILGIYLFNLIIEKSVIGYGDNALTSKQEAQIDQKNKNK